MDPRAELEQLRKLKRMRELEAKAGVQAAPKQEMGPTPQPAPESPSEGFPGSMDELKGRLTDPTRWQAILGYGPRARKDLVAGTPPLAAPIAAVPGAIAKGLTAINSSFKGRQALAGAQGAVTGATEPVEEGESRLGNAAKMGLMSLGIGVAGEGVGHVLGKGADYLMQKAVGAKKLIPGNGLELAEEGIMGTRDQIDDQVQRSIKKHDNSLLDAAKSTPGQVDSFEVGKKVLGATKKLQTQTGKVHAEDLAAGTKVQERAQSIADRGSLSLADALDTKRIAGRRGWTQGKERSGLDHELDRLEALGYGEQLGGAFEAAGKGELWKTANKRLGALTDASRAMDVPETLYKSPLSFSDLAMMGTGAAMNRGPEGVAGGLAASKAMKSSLLQSGVGQASHKLGKFVFDPNVAPLWRQALLEALKDEKK